MVDKLTKTDFKKSLKHLYQPSRNYFSQVTVPEMQFLMVDGHGDPNTATEYQQAIEALFAVAYKIKFMSKNELERDYVVPPMEGLWWAADMDTFITRDKSQWDWTMMIMQPDWIERALFEAANAEVKAKRDPAALSKLRLERYNEGLCLQIMHVGSFDDEAPTLHRLHHEYMPEHGFVFNGKHHEIYLSDFRKVAPEKLKTVLRQPVRKG